MATPYNTEKNETTGRDIASQFNEEQYDSLYQNDDPEQPTPDGRPFTSGQTPVTHVTVERGRQSNPLPSKKIFTAAVYAGSIAAAENKRRRRQPDNPLPLPKRNKLYFKALRNARRIIRDHKDLFEEGDELKISQTVPKDPPFPVVIMGLAILKDIIDLLDFTLIGIVLTTLSWLIIVPIIFFWMLGKMSGTWWKKKMFKWLVKRFALMMGLELIPFFKVVPTTALFVYIAHNHQKKLVRVANAILDELYNAGFIKIP